MAHASQVWCGIKRFPSQGVLSSEKRNKPHQRVLHLQTFNNLSLSSRVPGPCSPARGNYCYPHTNLCVKWRDKLNVTTYNALTLDGYQLNWVLVTMGELQCHPLVIHFLMIPNCSVIAYPFKNTLLYQFQSPLSHSARFKRCFKKYFSASGIPFHQESTIIIICDMIKRNESDVGHIVFEILAKTVFKFLCFTLYLSLTNSS